MTHQLRVTQTFKFSSDGLAVETIAAGTLLAADSRAAQIALANGWGSEMAPPDTGTAPGPDEQPGGEADPLDAMPPLLAADLQAGATSGAPGATGAAETALPLSPADPASAPPISGGSGKRNKRGAA